MTNSFSFLVVKSDKFVIVICGVILITVSTFQLFGKSVDYSEYLAFLRGYQYPGKNTPGEPAALIIRTISQGNPYIFFLVFTLIGVSTKLYAILNYSKHVYLSVLVYSLSLFLLHDYTQIRAGAAIGIFLLSINDLADRNWSGYFLKAILAILLHYSAFIMVPVFFVNIYLQGNAFRFLPFLGLGIVVFQVELFERILSLLGASDFLFGLFNQRKGHPGSIEILNLISISYLIIFYGISLIENKLDKLDHELYKVFGLSLFLFFSLSLFRMPVVTYRVSEFLNIALILLLPNILSYFKQKLFLACIMVMYFLLYFYHLIFKTGIIQVGFV